MYKLKTLFLLLTILLPSAAFNVQAQDEPGSSSDACPCFDAKVIDELKQSGDVECSFNIFRLEAKPNPSFDNDLIAECENCGYGSDGCFCSSTKEGTTKNLTESEFKSCQALITELLMSNGFQCAVSSD
jgi:hypothetical protein